MQQKNFIVSLCLTGGIMAVMGAAHLPLMDSSPALCRFSAAESVFSGAETEAEPGAAVSSGTMSLFPFQWGLRNEDFYRNEKAEALDVGAERAWKRFEAFSQRRQVVIALIDTGVDIAHPDLENSIWTNPGEVAGDGIDNDGNGFVDDVSGWNFIDHSPRIFEGGAESHGTHNAGILAAAWDDVGIRGIADNRWVKIMVLKAIDPVSNRGSNQAVREAIDYAGRMGADIVNLSMTSGDFDAVMYRQMAESRMLFVVAAGNGDEQHNGYDLDLRPAYPAAYDADNIISVANVGFDGSLDKTSNFGLHTVDIGAPGLYILSTIPGGLYDFKTGTSMAAPFVSGAAAMLYSTHPGASLRDVREALLKSARSIPALSGRVATGGILDFAGAMDYFLALNTLSHSIAEGE